MQTIGVAALQSGKEKEKGRSGFVTVGKANIGLLSLHWFLSTAFHFNMKTALLQCNGGSPGQSFFAVWLPSGGGIIQHWFVMEVCF